MIGKLIKIRHLAMFLGLSIGAWGLQLRAGTEQISFTEKSLYLYLVSQLNTVFLGPTLRSEELLTQAAKEDPGDWYIKYTIAEYHLTNSAFIKAKEELEVLRQAHPKNIDVRLLLAKVYTLLNYYDKSRVLYEEIIALDDHHEEALFHLSLVYAAQKKFKKSLEILARLQEFSERLSLVYLYEAKIHLEMSNEPGAIASLRKAIASKTEHPEVYLLLATLLETKGQRQEALKYYEEYSEVNPDDAEVLKKLVDEYIADNNYEKALPLLDELHRLDPSNHKISLKIALISIEFNRLTDARQMLEHILHLSPDMDIAQYYLGMVCQMQQDGACSQRAYGHVNSASPFYSESILQRAFTFIGLRQYDRAIEELKASRSKGVMDENITLVTSAAYELKGDLKPATDILDDFLKGEKNNTRVLYAKANILYKRQKYEDAVVTVKHLLQIDPNHVQGLNFLGYHLLTVGGSPHSAYGPLKRAYDLSPKDPYILDSWGWYWYVMDDLGKAGSYLENAFAMKQDDVTILEHLVQCLLKRGDPKKAQSYLDMGKAFYATFTPDERRKLEGLQSNIQTQQRALASESE